MADSEPQLEPQKVQELTPERQLLCARFSPDGMHLLAGGMDAQLHRWQLAEVEVEIREKTKDGESVRKETKNEWQALAPVAGHHGWLSALALPSDPKTQRVYTGDSWGQLRCSDFAGRSPKVHWSIPNAHDGWVRQIAVHANRLATASRDGAVRLWDAQGKRLAEWSGAEEIYALTFQPDGRRVVFGDMKGIVRVWNFDANKIEREFELNEFFKLTRLQDVCGLTRLMFLDGGKTLMVVGCAPTDGGTMQGIPTLDWIDYASGKSKSRDQFGVENDAFITDVAEHPKGYLICASSGVTGRGTHFFIKPGAEEPFYNNTKIANIHAVALHPDGKQFALTSTNRASNGNGRRLDKEGNYVGNYSPVHVMQLPA